MFRSTFRILGLLVMMMPVGTFAQQVIHIENRMLAATENGLSGNASLQVNFIQNINNILQTSNLFNVQYVSKEHSVLSVSNYSLTVVNDSRVVNEGYQHFRYNYKVSRLMTMEGYTQVQFNEVLKMRFRLLTGAGPRFSILENDSVRTRLFAGTSVMAEYEEETTGVVNRAMRMSQFLSIGFPFAKIFTVDAIAYYQPDLSFWEDFRTSIEARLEIRITARLTLELRQNVVYDSRPPEGIRHVFYNLSNGVRYRF